MEYVRAKGKACYDGYKSQFINYLSSEESHENNEDSSEDDFDKERNLANILKPDDKHNKIVVSVVDTGMGIKEKDKKRLFKLFGTI